MYDLSRISRSKLDWLIICKEAQQ